MLKNLLMVNRSELIEMVLMNKIKVRTKNSKKSKRGSSNTEYKASVKIYPKVIQLLKMQLYNGLSSIDMSDVLSDFPIFSLLTESKDPINDALELLMDMIPTTADNDLVAREKAIKLVDICFSLMERIDSIRQGISCKHSDSLANNSVHQIEFD